MRVYDFFGAAWPRNPSAVAVVILGLCATGSASAQTYPTSVVKLVVPFTPGTSMDIVARVVGAELAERFKQPVIVENLPGATGTIGSAQVARAAPDGQTLLVTSNNIVVAPLLLKSVPFDPLTDFAPITITSYSAMVLAVSNRSGLTTLADLTSYAKAHPAKLNYSSPGNGTTQHLSMEALKSALDINLVHIPYRGTAGALNDIISGDVDAGFLPVDVALPQFRAGNLKLLAVGSPERHPMLPDVPTLRESGIPNVESNPWHAFAAPRATPAAIVQKLNQNIRSVLDQPQTKTKLEATGLIISTGTPEHMLDVMKHDAAVAAEIIKRNNITTD